MTLCGYNSTNNIYNYFGWNVWEMSIIDQILTFLFTQFPCQTNKDNRLSKYFVNNIFCKIIGEISKSNNSAGHKE